MLKLLPALALVAVATVSPSLAAEAEDRVDLLLRCGAGYLLIADDPSIAETEEDKQTFTDYGTALLTMADRALAEAGVSEAEREATGFRIMGEVDTAMENGTDAGFEPEECLPLLKTEKTKATPSPEDLRDAKIDMLMTCGAGFILSSQTLQEQGEEADAAMLEELGNNHINAAEELMIQSGLGEEARFQISKMYGEQVGTKMRAGEDLPYDWDTCATIEY
ncbi:hypothetical protein IC608_16475 [Devosia sp. PTR5]|uniref:Uncharacterized protein n=1 Tax=Devosia oryzisoli TaxID=2774138 RepID=A0A927IUM3_9HYPH|nr:hypothetical protein [Devosia oryzisoli]MBD8067067.1 hypothetical protein [Devosia oryzisoli]